MNKELMEALDILEKEKEISKETLFEAIENSLLTACKNHFGKADNVKVEIDRKTCDFLVYAEKEIVATHEEVEDDCLQIALEDALEISKRAKVGDVIHVEISPRNLDVSPPRTRKTSSCRKSGKKKEALFTISILKKKKMWLPA